MPSTRFQQNVFIWVSSGDVEDFVSQSRSTAMGPGLVPLTCLWSHVLSVFGMGIPPRSFPLNTTHLVQGEAGQEKGPWRAGKSRAEPYLQLFDKFLLLAVTWRGFAHSCSSLAPTNFLHLLPSSHPRCCLCLCFAHPPSITLHPHPSGQGLS